MGFPIDGNESRVQTILILVKDFKLLIEVGNSSKKTRSAEMCRQNLVAIMETYRKFRLCLKGEVKESWLKVIEE